MELKKRVFLSAEWRYLAMLNYTIDPAVLKPLVPIGTELDSYEGNFFVSVVGFLFLNTKIFGYGIPFHRNFEELNLRFYVRRKTLEGWRRGAVFIKELVPRLAIAAVARTVYGEPYTALPMRHKIERNEDGITLEYGWYRRGGWERIHAHALGQPSTIKTGSLEEFIAEHYWGYSARCGGSREFAVEHPRWQIWNATEAALEADVATLYGDAFAESLSSPPTSTLIADGSPIIVRNAVNF